MALAGFLLLICSPGASVVAAETTTLNVSAPSSVDISEGFSVTATYRSNDTNLCSAICRISGGWLSGAVYLTETTGCEYSATLYAPDHSGSHILEVYCEKAGYGYRSEGFPMEVEKLDSELSVTTSPASPYPRDTVSVDAHYEDGYGDAIAGSCSASLEENGIEIGYVDMGYYGHYSGELVLPPSTGDYSITVTCTSEQYETESEEVSLDVSKMQAELSLSYPGVVYYGQEVEVSADYTHAGGVIQGSCTLSFGGTERQMGYSPAGYSSTVSIPYDSGRHSLEVRCSSSSHETRVEEAVLVPSRRPVRIALVLPGERLFYPGEEIPVKLSYLDSLTGEAITGARCVLDGSEQLDAEGGYHVTVLSGLGLGSHSLAVECSGEFHQEGHRTFTVDVVRMPLVIRFVDARDEYVYGKDIEIRARAVGLDGNDADVACRARVDSYGPLVGNLLDSYNADMVREDGAHALAIQGTGGPSRVEVTVTCSGSMYEEGTARTGFVTRQLSRETEEGMLIVLSAVSVALAALILLIRRKLKIL